MKLVFILPSTGAGGLERVITELVWHFARKDHCKVSLICLMKGEPFYPLPSNIQTFSPSFSLQNTARSVFLIKLMFWLRRKVSRVGAEALISFGGKFNAFVLLSVYGLNIRTYISDRSRPSISYGRFLDWLNPVVYKKSTGIIAQTFRAKDVMLSRTGHGNIRVIGNPIRLDKHKIEQRQNIILNVGRFIASKNQDVLIDYFNEIKPKGWKLYFIGDGKHLAKCKEKVNTLGLENDILFLGEVRNIEEYLYKSKIFAFVSTSEGFPNALAEAMAAGLACISFDCEAGPADLIDHKENGFLIKEYDHKSYVRKLKKLLGDNDLQSEFGKKAKQKIQKYNIDIIGAQFNHFILKK